MVSMPETMLSAGIDIGTTTTQVIFSLLTLEMSGGFGTAPTVKVTGRDVFYKGEPHITPLENDEYIDAEGVAALIKEEYQKAGMKPGQVKTGAVIITGETAKKRNARQVGEAVSRAAGDFVVAAAGPDFESFLAGKGAGADILSRRTGKRVLNIDIGGGTSNYCLFSDGEEADTGCLDIGGRMIRIRQDGNVAAITEKARRVLEKYGISVREDTRLTRNMAERIADIFARCLAEAAGLGRISPETRYLVTDHGLSGKEKPQIITFSGGVADCMSDSSGNLLRYGDLGVLLGQAVARNPAFRKMAQVPAAETVHATVIGAGSCSMSVSGSTILCGKLHFPMRNVPVYPLPYREEEDLKLLPEKLWEVTCRSQESEDEVFAVFLEGPRAPSFREIEKLADILTEGLPLKEKVIPIIVEHDFAKALGQAVRRRMPEAPVLCLDGIRCGRGDYVDIGQPVGGGIAIPVVIKALVYSADDGIRQSGCRIIPEGYKDI